MAQRYKRVIIQPDVPAVRDEFGGPFERVADAVVETIRTNNVGGKLIGLEGQWGGGKSTVLQHVFEALRKDKNFRVVMFDAWAHQGDPLRRSFLERIIDEFEKPRPWVSLEKDPETKLTRWQATREQLANRLSEERTTTVPEPNALGLCLGISALLVPAGIAVLSSAFQKESTLFDWLSPSTAIVLGLLLSFAPLVVFVVIMAIKAAFRLVVRSWKKAFAWFHKISSPAIWPLLRSADFSPLHSNAISKSVGKTIRTAEPTSVEFETEFSELIKEGLQSNESRHLVIAVDNLDRVDAKDALTIWSTLQTFVQERNGEGFAHFERVSFIVPYDPDGLARLWENQAVVGASELEDQSNNAVDNMRVAQSFIDKSFSIKFEVPPPVMSDWRKYLSEKLRAALPDHSQAERDSVVTIYDLWRSISHDTITPRKLKLLVNQICVVCRQWPTPIDAEKGEFALASIAYYALLRRSPTFRDVSRCLLPSRKQLPHSSVLHEVGEAVVQDLAGLAHNVEGQHGVQLVIGEEVKNAFFTGNESMLQDLAEQFKDGFWANIARITSRELPTADAKSACSCACGLGRVGWFEDDQPSREASQLLDRVCAWFKSSERLDGVDQESLDGLLAMIALRPQSEIAEAAIRLWQATLHGKGSEGEEANVESRVSLTLQLINAVSSHGLDSTLVEPFDMDIDADGWITATAQLKTDNSDKSHWKLFKPNGKTRLNEVGKAIHQAIADGTVTQSHRDCIEVSSEVFRNASWEGVCNKLADQLKASQSNELEAVEELVKTLLLVHELGMVKATESLADLASNGHLAHWMNEGQSDSKVAALLLIAQLIGDAAISFASSDATIQQGIQHFKKCLDSKDDELIIAIAAWCELFSLHSLPYDVADELGEYPALLQATLKHCANAPKESRGFFTPAIIKARWVELQDIIGDDLLTAVIESAVEQCDLCPSIQSSGFDRDNAGLYRYILEDTANPPESFKAWCSEQLPLLGKEDWESELEKAGDSIRMLSWFKGSGLTIELPRFYSDALLLLAAKVSKGESGDSLDSFLVARSSDWPTHLTDQVRGEYRSSLLRVVDEVPVGTTIPDAFFDMYGAELLEAAVNSVRDNNSTVLALARQMSAQAQNGSLAWLHSLLEKLNGNGTVLADDSELRERILGLLQSSERDSDLYKILETIADLMDIDVPSDGSGTPEEDVESAELAKDSDTSP